MCSSDLVEAFRLNKSRTMITKTESGLETSGIIPIHEGTRIITTTTVVDTEEQENTTTLDRTSQRTNDACILVSTSRVWWDLDPRDEYRSH